MKSISSLLIASLFWLTVGCASLQPRKRVESYTQNQRGKSAVQTDEHSKYSFPRSRTQASRDLKGKGCGIAYPHRENKQAEPITGTVASIGNVTVSVKEEKFGPEVVIETWIIGSDQSEYLPKTYRTIPGKKFP